ncbi:hypothetical protein COU89_02625 [Candidatus Roizmanbacteria bacterium CG10_big_fil_rev_8_21_14_0_10_45_7]|uniref:Uncharacterized protein n=1 Tax=Candidatus Roizmanbacteria bacterium CG10_big_fil_rev_8_21_14_0_10_45_7 TaxID=1974854 RepID=A0A2M8KUF4_9BACT|nr:MAG: hypothetical protein COU89_02625 [Candidatus Roizmanbacteria bacterium CG10_big_fil_rev_8_21_14_0_10_45_7]
MNLLELLNGIIITIGLPALTITSIYMGRKLQTLDDIVDKTKGIDKKISGLANANNSIGQAVIEIQNFIRERGQVDLMSKVIPYDEYGVSNSPMVLKEEYRRFITKTSLAKQIEEKNDKLVVWLKQKKPETGIDAQQYIEELVTSGSIEQILDLKKYKEYLYQTGRTQQDVIGILTVYLFEKIIPQVIK